MNKTFLLLLMGLTNISCFVTLYFLHKILQRNNELQKHQESINKEHSKQLRLLAEEIKNMNNY